ncbi:MAG: site-2 protease family protein [Holophagaceae bacterium]|nr:site-2 protease family protein [Holophagaceae bacterium]
MFDSISIPTILVSYVALLFSLSVHEASHATAAYWLEDDTAARLGRMTLNPLAHIDPIGTVLFPLIGMTTGIPMIGWAKPVPVNPANYTRRFSMRTGDALVSAAGPGSNVVLAILSIILLTLGLRFLVPGHEERWAYFVGALNGFESLSEMKVDPTTSLFLALTGRLILVNFGLALFNLLPVGPLDGAAVLRAFLPYRAAQVLDKYRQHMYIVLLALVFLGGMKYVFAPAFRLYIHFLAWVAPTLLGV